jgi:hypothetical protein
MRSKEKFCGRGERGCGESRARTSSGSGHPLRRKGLQWGDSQVSKDHQLGGGSAGKCSEMEEETAERLQDPERKGERGEAGGLLSAAGNGDRRLIERGSSPNRYSLSLSFRYLNSDAQAGRGKLAARASFPLPSAQASPKR